MPGMHAEARAYSGVMDRFYGTGAVRCLSSGARTPQRFMDPASLDAGNGTPWRTYQSHRDLVVVAAAPPTATQTPKIGGHFVWTEMT